MNIERTLNSFDLHEKHADQSWHAETRSVICSITLLIIFIQNLPTLSNYIAKKHCVFLHCIFPVGQTNNITQTSGSFIQPLATRFLDDTMIIIPCSNVRK